MTTLPELAHKWGTDKALYYAEFYEKLFLGKRDIKKVLEFGIGSPDSMLGAVSRLGFSTYITGASLLMWEEYFPKALIYGLDNRHDLLQAKGRITCFFCEQSNEQSYLDVIPLIGGDFDLIIDDGSHVPEDQLLCARMLVPLLGKDGIYVIEDAPIANQEFLDNLEYSYVVADFNDDPLDPARLVVIRK